MKRRTIIALVMMLALAMIMMASCAKSEFSGDVTDEKNMTITAKNADEGDFFVTGTLAVGEDEQIAIDSALEKGEITIEFISAEGNDNIEELPELDREAAYTAFISGESAQSVSFGAGEFMIKPTVTGKATGTVTITVKEK